MSCHPRAEVVNEKEMRTLDCNLKTRQYHQKQAALDEPSRQTEKLGRGGERKEEHHETVGKMVKWSLSRHSRTRALHKRVHMHCTSKIL